MLLPWKERRCEAPGVVNVRRQTSYNDYMGYYTATSEALALEGHAPWRTRASQEPKHSSRPKRSLRKEKHTARRKPKLSANDGYAKKISIPKKRKRVIYIKSMSNVKFFSWRLLITLFAIFFGMISTASSSAVLRKNHTELNTMRGELVLMQDEEAILRARISEEYDMAQIEKIATMRFNMSKPKAHQIVYIYLPKQDYVVHHGIADYDSDSKGFWEIIGGMLNSAKATLFSIFPG